MTRRLAPFIVVAMLIAAAISGVPRSRSALAVSTNVVFGLNMPLFDGNEQMLGNGQTQAILAGWHTPVVRMPFRSGLADAVELRALQTIKTIGAIPLVIVHGAPDTTVSADDAHLLALTAQVFGSSLVYVEYGNEEDLAGIDATAYTNSWNATVPLLKAQHPTYLFIGPVNFQSDPTYIGYFVAHAQPLPDVVSWHEYVCNTSESTPYCMSHIARWSVHAGDTNAAEVAAIGHTIPFMITEWNLDPQNDPRYLDPTVMGPWTAAAVQELQSLVSSGLIGAQLYAADSHGGGFELIDGSNNLTPEGQAFQAAFGGSLPVTPSVVPPSQPSPSPAPTLPAPAPTTSPSTSAVPPTVAPRLLTTPGGTVRFDFEDGSTQGWSKAWGPARVGDTTAVAFTGHASLVIETGNGYPAVDVRVHTLTAGTTVTYYVYATTAGGRVTPFAADTAYRNHFTNAVVLGAGWNKVTWSVAAMSSVRSIGLQVDLAPGTIALDSVSW